MKLPVSECLSVGEDASNSRRLIYLMLLLSMLLCLPIWIVEYPPLTDYPNHLLRVQIIKEYSNPIYGYSEYFSIRRIPSPYLLSDGILLALCLIFPLMIAGKLLLSLLVIATPFAILYFISAISNKNRWLALFGFCFIYTFYFNEGFLGYCLSIPAVFITLGYWLKVRSDMTLGRGIILMLLASMAYFSHIAGYAILLWSVFLLSLMKVTETKHPVKSLMPFLPSALLFIWYLLYVTILGSASGTPLAFVFGGLLHNMIGIVVFCFISCFRIEHFIYAIPPACLFFLVLWAFIETTRENGLLTILEVNAGVRHGVFLILGLSLCAFYFIMPEWIGYFWANIRLIPFFFLFPLAYIARSHIPRIMRIGIPIIIILFSIFQGFCISGYYLHFRPYFRDFESGLTHLDPRPRLMPLMVNTKCGSDHYYPFYHAWAYYIIDKGGVAPYLFAYEQSILRYRDDIPKPSAPNFFDSGKFQIDDYEAFYSHVMLWGDDSLVVMQLERRYNQIYQQGNLRLYKHK